MTPRPFQPPHGDECPVCHPAGEHDGLFAVVLLALAALVWWFAS